MRRTFPAAFAAVASILALMCNVAQAATAQRTFVASIGNDANACSLAAPCRSFGVAITHTSAGGEVIVLDSAGYGPVAINKSVSIIAPDGVYAGISVSSGNGVNVDAPGGIVRLRGLSMNGLSSSGIGIKDVAAAELDVERCLIAGFSALNGSGIVVRTSVDPAQLRVAYSTLSDNWFGVSIESPSGTPYISIEGARFTGHFLALGVFASARVTVHASAMQTTKDIPNAGIRILSPVAGPVELHVDESVIDGAARGIDARVDAASYVSISLVHTAVSHTGFGMYVTGSATAAIADSRFTHNDTAIFVDAGSTVFTGGTTYMAYNGGGNVVGPGTFNPPAGNL